MFGLRGKSWSLALPRLNVRHVQKLGTGCFLERLQVAVFNFSFIINCVALMMASVLCNDLSVIGIRIEQYW
jgi:hypothetical protein